MRKLWENRKNSFLKNLTITMAGLVTKAGDHLPFLFMDTIDSKGSGSFSISARFAWGYPIRPY
ncbi:MAG: hypothetical protein KJO61_11820, partial [Deltaproteobacteria bacterium]|nr:hypothetical protein [Deltaproteobacteria bacterium]